MGTYPRLPRLREVAALLSPSTLLGVVPQPTDSRLSETSGNGARGRAVTIIKKEMELDADFNEIACISYFKMLTLASETSIYPRTDEINCHYLMTLSVLRYAV